MPRLKDISGDELSLVGRGAVRPKFAFRKSDDGHLEIDERTLAVLTEKADGEDELLKALANVDADAGLSAITAYRLLKAHAGSLPEGHPFRKAMDAMAEDAEDAADGGDDEQAEGEADGEEAAAKKRIKKYEQILKAKYTADQLAAMAKNGEALPDESYPIGDKQDLEKAIHAVGRGKNNSHADIRAHIAKRAKQLGATDLLPADWNVSKEDATMTDTATVPVKKEDGTWDLTGVPEDQRSGMEAFLKAQDAAREAELEAVRKAAEDEKSELQKTADDALSIAKAERDARETREYVAKAEQLGESGEEFGPVLKSIHQAVDAETFEKLESVLKANHGRAVTAGLYKEIGKSGNGSAAGDAKTQLDTKADEIRKSDPSLTNAQALVKAYEANPELYAQLRNEES